MVVTVVDLSFAIDVEENGQLTTAHAVLAIDLEGSSTTSAFSFTRSKLQLVGVNNSGAKAGAYLLRPGSGIYAFNA